MASASPLSRRGAPPRRAGRVGQELRGAPAASGHPGSPGSRPWSGSSATGVTVRGGGASRAGSRQNPAPCAAWSPCSPSSSPPRRRRRRRPDPRGPRWRGRRAFAASPPSRSRSAPARRAIRTWRRTAEVEPPQGRLPDRHPPAPARSATGRRASAFYSARVRLGHVRLEGPDRHGVRRPRPAPTLQMLDPKTLDAARAHRAAAARPELGPNRLHGLHAAAATSTSTTRTARSSRRPLATSSSSRETADARLRAGARLRPHERRAGRGTRSSPRCRTGAGACGSPRARASSGTVDPATGRSSRWTLKEPIGNSFAVDDHGRRLHRDRRGACTASTPAPTARP